MRNRSVRKYFPVVLALAGSLCANLALADWSAPPPQSYKRQGFGDFPPKNIDEILQQESEKSDSMHDAGQLNQDQLQYSQPATTPAPAGGTANTGNSNQPGAVQSLPGQNSQVPAYGSYPVPNYGNTNAYQRGGPWGNRGSGFSMPWGNNNSGFSGPWNNNRGSGFSMPWGNNNSGFSGPWNNNGSSFTGPWNNSGSGTVPYSN